MSLLYLLYIEDKKKYSISLRLYKHVVESIS
jgi:hypothetical protein